MTMDTQMRTILLAS